MFATELGLPLAILFFTIVGMIVFRGSKALFAGLASDPKGLIVAAYFLGFVGVMGFAMFDLSFYDARVNVLGVDHAGSNPEHACSGASRPGLWA